MVADSPDEVRVRAREQLMLGATQIKLTAGGGIASPHSPLDVSTFTEPELRAAVEAAAGGKVDLTDPAHLSVGAWIAVLAPLALNFVLQVVQIVMIYSPFAVAYQQIHGDAPTR